ncbi:MAG: fused MFS/spermidine synthase, partial [Planctomycetes bacterium]|nr:fused MFS/spermidine synthase [Planctomycetota bacterium]
ALALAFSAHALLEALPHTQPTEVFLPAVREKLGWMYTWDFARCFAAIALAPLCWGAAFPLGVAALAGGGLSAERAVAHACATNTFGAIAGTAAVSFYAIAAHGTHFAVQGLVLASALAAALGVHAALIRGAAVPRRTLRATCAALCMLACGSLLAWRGLPEVPIGLLAYGRRVERWNDGARVLHVREGHSTAVAVTEQDDGARNFHVSGKIVASGIPLDMRLQRLLGHIPALLHPHPRSVLIVGCGAGVTAGCFVDHPSIERIVICEIEPVVPEAARLYFDEENRGVLRDPRTQVIRDDARHFLATSRERFDLVTSDPIHPWVAGAAALYTAEYYQLCLEHLAPGGIFTQWVPLYETSEAAVKSELRTFFDAFPEGSIWSSDPDELGYDVVMLGSREPLRIDADALEERLARAPEAWTSLEELDLASAQALLETYAGRGPELRGWLADAEPNLDRSLRLQYLAGASVERQDGERIFSAMLRYRRYPETLLVPPPYCEAELRARFDGAPR